MTGESDRCAACNGTGTEVYAYSTHPFEAGVRSRCFDCDGTGQRPRMLHGRELAEFVAGEHGKEAA